MIFELLRIIFGTLLVLFLPGIAIVQALFPEKDELDEEFDLLYRITLGIVFSIVTVIVWGLILSTPKLKMFDIFHITAGLSSITIFFFVIGWYRGGYPWMVKIHPKLARVSPGVRARLDELMSKKEFSEELLKVQSFAHKREEIRKKLKDAERKSMIAHPSIKAYYKARKEAYLADLAELDKKEAELRKRGV